VFIDLRITRHDIYPDRGVLEKHELAGALLNAVNQVLQGHGLMLKIGTVVDATLISAPSSTKNRSGERDPEMHQTKKGNIGISA
jgi:transposase, IS5 family